MKGSWYIYMPNVFYQYKHLRLKWGHDIAKYIIENFVKRKNVKIIEKCCRHYNHYTPVIKFCRNITFAKAVRIQIQLKNLTLIFHNINFPNKEGKTYRTDAIMHKDNVNIYIANYVPNNIQDYHEDSEQAQKILSDIKEGIFDDYALIKALRKCLR